MSAARVLHVDDDPEQLDLSRRMAAREGWEFGLSVAESGTEGLRLLRERRVDCVVTDALDVPDGRPFALAVRQRAPRVPIVLLSEEPRRAVPGAAAAETTEFVRKDGRRGIETAFRYADSLIRECEAGRDIGPDWRVVETCDPDDADDLTLALAGAVESLVGAGTTRRTPLFEAIDTDALEGVLASTSATDRQTVQVRFRYRDYELLVAGDGTIAARAATA